MKDQASRLRLARERRGYDTASDAARAFGWGVSTYSAHENGQNKLRQEAARRYATAFGVSWLWLFSGEGDAGRLSVPIVGLAGANPDGSINYGDGQGELGDAPMPPGGSEKTVAVEVRGDSMRGIADDGWLVYYDDVRDPPTDDLSGEVCVVGLADGRVLVKKMVRGRKKKHFDLESTGGQPTIYDAKVEWAAAVIAIVPRRQAQRMVVRGAA